MYTDTIANDCKLFAPMHLGYLSDLHRCVILRIFAIQTVCYCRFCVAGGGNMFQYQATKLAHSSQTYLYKSEPLSLIPPSPVSSPQEKEIRDIRGQWFRVKCIIIVYYNVTKLLSEKNIIRQCCSYKWRLLLL